jgi:FkbM family methyltransferase
MDYSDLLLGCFLNKHKITPLRKLIKNTLIRMTGNRFCQDLLEEFVQICHILQGVGSGSSEVGTSGEQAIFDTLRQRFSAPFCILDVGSNKGQFLQLTLENMAADNLSIHCFEPGHETFKILAESYSSDPRITLNKLAIGKDSGEGLLYYDSVGSGLASLTKRKLDHLGISFEQCEPVNITTIDDYCLKNRIDHIHLLKIDIEGHELNALAGAKNMFAKKSIDIVTLEFGGCNVDTRTFFQDFWYFFYHADMQIYRITPTGYLYPIESYSEIHEKFGVTNLLAILNI